MQFFLFNYFISALELSHAEKSRKTFWFSNWHEVSFHNLSGPMEFSRLYSPKSLEAYFHDNFQTYQTTPR